MRRTRKNYTEPFKRKAVKLSYLKGNVEQICRELNIFTSVLHRWRKEEKVYGKNSFPGKGKPKLTDDQRDLS